MAGSLASRILTEEQCCGRCLRMWTLQSHCLRYSWPTSQNITVFYKSGTIVYQVYTNNVISLISMDYIMPIIQLITLLYFSNLSAGSKCWWIWGQRLDIHHWKCKSILKGPLYTARFWAVPDKRWQTWNNHGDTFGSWRLNSGPTSYCEKGSKTAVVMILRPQCQKSRTTIS